MYIPIIKNRQSETKVFKNMNYCLNDEIIPLIEVIKDEYQKNYLTDPTTGKYVMEQKPGKKKRNKIPLPPTEDDIITLDSINKIIDGKQAFIDYFRYLPQQYGGNSIEIEKCRLSWELSNNAAQYEKRLIGVSKYSNLIPVISIKDGFVMNSKQLTSIINCIHTNGSSVAIRLTQNYLPIYNDILELSLLPSDYILFDIGEHKLTESEVSIKLFSNLHTNAKKILINSPRKAGIKNAKFVPDEDGITNLIDNSAKTTYSSYAFDGFSDYGGLTDKLPTKGGGKAKGCALALIYSAAKNAFFSFLNPDVDQGTNGYASVISAILSKKDFLDPGDDCEAFKIIHKYHNDPDTNGGWKEWHEITLTRYLHQIFKEYQNPVH